MVRRADKPSRLAKRLLSSIAKASKEFELIEPGDRIMVAMSGGKDSYAMLALLRQIEKRVPFSFSMVAVNLDQGHPGFPAHRLEAFLHEQGYDYRMLKQDTYSVVLDLVPQGKTACSLCSRLRRGALYAAAVELGCNKIALGHHRDDVIETLLLNLFFAGQVKSMAPRLLSDDGRNIVIRPLLYCAEEDIAQFALEQRFPILPCNLCGSQPNLQRQKVKELLRSMQQENNNIKGNLMAALGNIVPSHLLDKSLWGPESRRHTD